MKKLFGFFMMIFVFGAMINSCGEEETTTTPASTSVSTSSSSTEETTKPAEPTTTEPTKPAENAPAAEPAKPAETTPTPAPATTTTESSSSGNIGVGKDAVLNGDVFIGVGEDKDDAYNEMMDYIVAQNKEALMRMVLEGRVVLGEKGTPITIVDLGFINAKIEIIETGVRGWIPIEYLGR